MFGGFSGPFNSTDSYDSQGQTETKLGLTLPQWRRAENCTPTRQITTNTEKTFPVFSSVAVRGLFLEWA